MERQYESIKKTMIPSIFTFYQLLTSMGFCGKFDKLQKYYSEFLDYGYE